MTIILNGERFELDQPLSVTELLAKLDIDPRRVAIEHNLDISSARPSRRPRSAKATRLEIVNFVGGGRSRLAVGTSRGCTVHGFDQLGVRIGET